MNYDSASFEKLLNTFFLIAKNQHRFKYLRTIYEWMLSENAIMVYIII